MRPVLLLHHPVILIGFRPLRKRSQRSVVAVALYKLTPITRQTLDVSIATCGPTWPSVAHHGLNARICRLRDLYGRAP